MYKKTTATSNVRSYYYELYLTSRCVIFTTFYINPIFNEETSNIQGGSNMTGTDLCVNKPHCPAAVRPSLLLGLEHVQSCLGVARVMSNYGYKKKKSVPVIFEPPCN